MPFHWQQWWNSLSHTGVSHCLTLMISCWPTSQCCGTLLYGNWWISTFFPCYYLINNWERVKVPLHMKSNTWSLHLNTENVFNSNFEKLVTKIMDCFGRILDNCVAETRKSSKELICFHLSSFLLRTSLGCDFSLGAGGKACFHPLRPVMNRWAHCTQSGLIPRFISAYLPRTKPRKDREKEENGGG